MVSHWSLIDNKSPQVSRTLLSILADLNNAIVWMVSSSPLIFKSFSPCTNPLVTVPRAPIKIGIIVTFMFPSIPSNYCLPQLWSELQDSAFLSEVAVNHLKKARGEIWPKRSEEETKINTKMRTKSPQ